LRYLVIAAPTDETAIRVYCELRSRHGADAVKIVSSEELEMAPRWILQLDSREACSEVRLASGLTIESGAVSAVFQRIRYAQAPHFAASSQYDREYAAAEMHAVLLSWLASLRCPVVNPPHPMGLGGLERRQIDWLLLGMRAGLPVIELELTVGLGETLEPLGMERRSVLVAGASVVGDVPDGHAEACVRLAALSGCTLLEVFFAPAADGWRFVGATPYPSDAARIVAGLERLT
jgi:hypothetical protein